jgi:hypothetical protein
MSFRKGEVFLWNNMYLCFRISSGFRTSLITSLSIEAPGMLSQRFLDFIQWNIARLFSGRKDLKWSKSNNTCDFFQDYSITFWQQVLILPFSVLSRGKCVKISK